MLLLRVWGRCPSKDLGVLPPLSSPRGPHPGVRVVFDPEVPWSCHCASPATAGPWVMASVSAAVGCSGHAPLFCYLAVSAIFCFSFVVTINNCVCREFFHVSNHFLRMTRNYWVEGITPCRARGRAWHDASAGQHSGRTCAERPPQAPEPSSEHRAATPAIPNFTVATC